MAIARTPVIRVAIVAIVTGALQFASYGPVLSASSETSARELTLTLASTQPLPSASASALIAEATAIWKESRVALRWVAAGSEEQHAVLRVLVKAGLVPSGELSPLTVGELVRGEGSRALATASITGARRIVDESGWRFDDLPAMRERRLGLVLGRAVAHEIGHYLLGTNTHSTQGLMRARIDAREFADLRSGSFRLDRAAQARLDTLAARGPLPLEAPSAGFSYSWP